MNKRYVKTAAGHAEIQAKALALSRPVRNLLLLINDSQPGEVWLQQIRGLADTWLRPTHAYTHAFREVDAQLSARERVVANLLLTEGRTA